jgi:rhodanese-related sulfurtransferase
MATYKTISALEANELLQKDQAVIIDVRTSEEFQSCHIPRAIWVPLDSIVEEFSKLNIPADKDIILQCQKGKRSADAIERLIASAKLAVDAEKLHNLEGGIESWKAEELDVIARPDKTLVDNIKDKVDVDCLTKCISRKKVYTRLSKLTIAEQVKLSLGVIILALYLLIAVLGIDVISLVGIIALAMIVSAITGWCGLEKLLKQAPWNDPTKITVESPSPIKAPKQAKQESKADDQDEQN